MAAVSIYEKPSEEDASYEDIADHRMVHVGIQGINFFANYLCIWGSMSKTITMFFSSSQIYSTVSNSTNNIYLSFEIYAKNVLKYSIGFPEENTLVSTVSTNDLEGNIRTSAKTTIGVFSIWADDTRIYYNPSEKSNLDDLSQGIVIQSGKPDENSQLGLKPLTTKSLTNILVSEFVDILSKSNKAKVTMMIFTPYKNGIKISGLNTLGQERTFKNFGDISEEYTSETEADSKAIENLMKNFGHLRAETQNVASVSSRPNISVSKTDNSIYVPFANVKPFIKLKGVSVDPDILVIRYDQSGVFMFEGRISNIGKHRFFIRGNKQNWSDKFKCLTSL